MEQPKSEPKNSGFSPAISRNLISHSNGLRGHHDGLFLHDSQQMAAPLKGSSINGSCFCFITDDVQNSRTGQKTEMEKDGIFMWKSHYVLWVGYSESVCLFEITLVGRKLTLLLVFREWGWKQRGYGHCWWLGWGKKFSEMQVESSKPQSSAILRKKGTTSLLHSKGCSIK